MAGTADLSIRRVGPDDGPLLRAARLRALTDAPDAFGQRLPEALAISDASWQATARAASRGHSRAWFLADGPDGVMGVVMGRRRLPDTLLIFSMWVDPTARRAGLGRRLIETAERWARTWDGRYSILWVLAANAPALRFYERLDFRVIEEGPDAEIGARHDSLAMIRPIVVEPEEGTVSA